MPSVPQRTPSPAMDASAPRDSESSSTAPQTAPESPAGAPSLTPDASQAPGEHSFDRQQDSAGSAGPPPILTPSDESGRKLVYSVDMQLQTTEFMYGVRILYNTISQLNGFIMSENVRGHDLRHPEQERMAFYTLRLYTDNVPEFIVIMEDNFNLLNRQLNADDITVNYEQTGFTINDLYEEESWLLEELEDPDLEDEERRDVENALTQVRSFIRSLEMQRSVMDDDIYFSFINVQLFEVIFVEEEEEEEEKEEDVVELTFGERFSNAASQSLGSFIGFGQGLLIVIIVILPTLLILAAIAVIALFIVRKYKKWRAANPKKPKEQPATAATNKTNPAVYQNWNTQAQQHYYNPNTAYSNQNAQNTNPATPPDANNANNSDQSGTSQI